MSVVPQSLSTQSTWIVEPTQDQKIFWKVGDFIMIQGKEDVRIIDTLGVQAFDPNDGIIPQEIVEAAGEYMLLYKKDNLIGLQSLDGKNILPNIYEDIKPISKHFFVVTKYNSKALVNDRNQLIHPYNEKIRSKVLTDSTIIVTVDFVDTYYDFDGDTLDYLAIKTLTSKHKTDDITYTINNDELWGIVQNERDTIIPFKYEDIIQIGIDQYLCMDNSNYGIITKDKTIVPFEYTRFELKELGENLVVILENRKNNTSLAYIPEFKRIMGKDAERIVVSEDRLTLIPVGKKHTELNMFSKELKPILTVNDKFEYLTRGLIAKYADGSSTVINSLGDKIFEIEGVVKKSFLNLHIVEKDNLMGLVSRTGEIIVPPKYKEIEDRKGIYRCVTSDKEFEHYTPNGVLIPYQSSKIERIRNTPFYTTKKDSYSYKIIIDEKGDVIFDDKIVSVSTLNPVNTHLLEMTTTVGKGILRIDQ